MPLQTPEFIAKFFCGCITTPCFSKDIPKLCPKHNQPRSEKWRVQAQRKIQYSKYGTNVQVSLMNHQRLTEMAQFKKTTLRALLGEYITEKYEAFVENLTTL